MLRLDSNATEEVKTEDSPEGTRPKGSANHTIPGRELEPPKPQATGASCSAGTQRCGMAPTTEEYPEPRKLIRKGSSSNSSSESATSSKPGSLVSCRSQLLGNDSEAVARLREAIEKIPVSVGASPFLDGF